MAGDGRRTTGYWAPFNVWWRAHLNQHGERPKAGDLRRWHKEDSRTAFPLEPPTYTMIRNHAKGLRDIASVKEYFRDYRARKRRAVADLEGSPRPRRAGAAAEEDEDEGEEEASGSECSWESGSDSGCGTDEEGPGGAKRTRKLAASRRAASRRSGQPHQRGGRARQGAQQPGEQEEQHAEAAQQLLPPQPQPPHADDSTVTARLGAAAALRTPSPCKGPGASPSGPSVRPPLPQPAPPWSPSSARQQPPLSAADAVGRRGGGGRNRATASAWFTEPPCTPPASAPSANTQPFTALTNVGAAKAPSAAPPPAAGAAGGGGLAGAAGVASEAGSAAPSSSPALGAKAVPIQAPSMTGTGRHGLQHPHNHTAAAAVSYDVARQEARATRSTQRPSLGYGAGSGASPVTPVRSAAAAAPPAAGARRPQPTLGCATAAGAAGGARSGGGAAPQEELYAGLQHLGGGPASNPAGAALAATRMEAGAGSVDAGKGGRVAWTPFALAASGDLLPWHVRCSASSGAEDGGTASRAAALLCTSAAMSYGTGGGGGASSLTAGFSERRSDAALDAAAGRLQQQQPSMASRSAPPDAYGSTHGNAADAAGGDSWLRQPHQHVLPPLGSRHGSSGQQLLPWGAPEGALLAEGSAACALSRGVPSPFAAASPTWADGRRLTLPEPSGAGAGFSARHFMPSGGALGGPPPVTTGFGQGRGAGAPPGASPGGGRSWLPLGLQPRAGAGSPPAAGGEGLAVSHEPVADAYGWPGGVGGGGWAPAPARGLQPAGYGYSYAPPLPPLFSPPSRHSGGGADGAGPADESPGGARWPPYAPPPGSYARGYGPPHASWQPYPHPYAYPSPHPAGRRSATAHPAGAAPLQYMPYMARPRYASGPLQAEESGPWLGGGAAQAQAEAAPVAAGACGASPHARAAAGSHEQHLGSRAAALGLLSQDPWETSGYEDLRPQGPVEGPAVGPAGGNGDGCLIASLWAMCPTEEEEPAGPSF